MFGAPPTRLPQLITLFLLPKFSMMGFASAIEPLRSANRMSGRALYTWHILSKDGEPVTARAPIPARFRPEAMRWRAPTRHYLEIHLNRARLLLQQTDLSVLGVALACGFVSASHFSKCYREFFGKKPREERMTSVPLRRGKADATAAARE